MIRLPPPSTNASSSAVPTATPSAKTVGKAATAKAKAKAKKAQSKQQFKSVTLPESVIVNLLLHITDRSNLLELCKLNAAWFNATQSESIDNAGWKRMIRRDAPFSQAVLSPWFKAYWGPTICKRGMSHREMYFASTAIKNRVQIVPLANLREPFLDLHPIAYGQDLPGLSCPPGTVAIGVNRDRVYATDRDGQVTLLKLSAALDKFEDTRIEHYRRRPLPYGFIRMSPDAINTLATGSMAVAAHSRPVVTCMPYFSATGGGPAVGLGPAPFVAYQTRDSTTLLRIYSDGGKVENAGSKMRLDLWTEGDTCPNEKSVLDLDGRISITCSSPNLAIIELRSKPITPSSSIEPLSSADDYLVRLLKHIPLTPSTQLVAITVTPCGWAFAASRDRLWAQRCRAGQFTKSWFPISIVLPEGHVFASRPIKLANNGTTAFIATRSAEDGDADDTYQSNYWSMLVVQLTSGSVWTKPFRGIVDPIKPREIEGVRDFGIVDGQLVVVSFEGELVMSPPSKIERLEKRLPLHMVVASQFTTEMAALVVMPRDLSAFFPYG